MVERVKIEGAKDGRPLHHSLQNVRRGEALAEAGQELANILYMAAETGRQGKLTLEIVVKPVEKGSKQMQIEDTVKATYPRCDPGRTFMFVGDDGSLTRHDPDQEDIENLRSVEDTGGKLKEAK